LFAVMMEAYLHGVSTRKGDDLVKALRTGTGISKSEVSRICADLDTEVGVLGPVQNSIFMPKARKSSAAIPPDVEMRQRVRTSRVRTTASKRCKGCDPATTVSATSRTDLRGHRPVPLSCRTGAWWRWAIRR
jgi:hypothetical protein